MKLLPLLLLLGCGTANPLSDYFIGFGIGGLVGLTIGVEIASKIYRSK